MRRPAPRASSSCAPARSGRRAARRRAARSTGAAGTGVSAAGRSRPRRGGASRLRSHRARAASPTARSRSRPSCPRTAGRRWCRLSRRNPGRSYRARLHSCRRGGWGFRTDGAGRRRRHVAAAALPREPRARRLPRARGRLERGRPATCSRVSTSTRCSLDLHLGDGDGRDLLRELGPGRPPVALFTGTEPDRRARRARGRGAPEAVRDRPAGGDGRAARARPVGTFRPVTTTGVYTPLDYEARLKQFLFESSEEGRAVRVGEKETSEQAEIVARYADLFTRDQLAGAARGRERGAGRRPRAALPAAQGLRGRHRLRRARRARGRAGEPPARGAADVPRRGDAAAHRPGEARGARRVRRPRGARRRLRRPERELQRRPARRWRVRGRSSRPTCRASPTRSPATRRRRASRCARWRRRWPRRPPRPPRRTCACARPGSSASSARTATTSRARTTWRTCAGSRRSSPRTRRSARPRSASQTLKELGFDLAGDPNIRPDLDDRPQKAPRACVIASDPPTVVHLITRAQGGLHDYQAFLHEAGHALHYAGCDPSLPYTFRRLSRDHALTEIYSYIVEAISREPGWHALHFGLSDEEAVAERRGDDVPRGAAVPPLRREAGVRARLLDAASRRTAARPTATPRS